MTRDELLLENRDMRDALEEAHEVIAGALGVDDDQDDDDDQGDRDDDEG